MKKITAFFLILFSIITSFFVQGYAFSIMPPEGSEVCDSFDSLPSLSDSTFGNFSIVQSLTQYEENIATDLYYRIWKASKPVSLPYKCISGENILDYSTAAKGSTFTIEYIEEKTETTTYEKIVTSETSTVFTQNLKEKIGFPIAEISYQLQQSLQETISTSIRNETSYSTVAGTRIVKSYTIPESGYYRYQYRASFQLYYIQMCGIVYKTITKNNRTYRNGIDYYYYMKEPIVKLSYKGGNVEGLYLYQRVSDGIHFIFNDKYCLDTDWIVYI